MRLPRITYDKSEPGVWISAGTHAVLLALALFAVAAPALPNAEEGVPVEVLTEQQFSELTRGQRDADKPQENPNKADRVAETVEEREPENAKLDKPAPAQRTADMKLASVDDIPLRAETPDPAKEEAAAAAAKAAEAKAEAERAAAAAKTEKAEKAKAEAAAKAQAQAQAKAEAEKREELQKLVEREEAEAAAKEAAKEAAKKAAEAKAKAEAKAEAKAKAEAEKAKAEAEKKLAEAKEKAEADAKAKAEAKAKAVAEAKAKAAAEAKAKKQAELANRYSPGDIRQLLANKAPSQSTGSTGHEVHRTASLGTSTGNAQRLSPSMRDALVGMLQQQIERCYSAPPGASQGVILPMLDIKLNPDGSLSTAPRVMRAGQNSVDQSIAQAALRAVRRCAPYKIPAQYAPYYNDWKAINAEFEFSQA